MRDERFEDTVFLVEADSYARLALWAESARASTRPIKDRTFSWMEDSSGFAQIIGFLLTEGGVQLPVACEVSFARIDGFRVAFYSSGSRAVDWNMIRGWICEQCPGAETCDAMNFHQCLQEIERLTALSEVHES